MRSVIIAHQTVIDGDAVGNDILGMMRILRERGYDVSIFADFYLGSFSSLTNDRKKALKAAKDESSFIIYHHSIFWESGEQFLSNGKGKIIFRYHNITPPDFFKNYSSLQYEKCRKGLDQTKKFIQQFQTSPWYTCSNYSRIDLIKRGLNPDLVMILPPFNQLELLNAIEPDFTVIHQLIRNRKNNIMFIGRVAPNKGYKHLFYVLKEYRERYDQNIHLWLIGPQDTALQKYTEEMEKIILDYNLRDMVTFTGKIPLNLVKSYYLSCDAFLCMSEHEGFCVPVIESQKLMLPVITTQTAALAETAGRNQIVIEESDYAFAAAALKTVYSDSTVRKFCQRYGLVNVDKRFSNSIICAKFLENLQKINWEGPS